MISLAVTTSTATVGVAVGDGEQVLGFEQEITERRHAEELAPMIQRVLQASSVSMAEISRFVVDVGPGRFTGLRVGLATIRTLALALDKAVVPLMVSVDARRGEVFQQHFVAGLARGKPQVGAPEKLVPSLDGVVVVGDGVDRYPELYGAAGVAGCQVQADVMLSLAGAREAVAGVAVEPLYLREPDANPNVKTRPRVPQQWHMLGHGELIGTRRPQAKCE